MVIRALASVVLSGSDKVRPASTATACEPPPLLRKAVAPAEGVTTGAGSNCLTVMERVTLSLSREPSLTTMEIVRVAVLAPASLLV